MRYLLLLLLILCFGPTTYWLLFVLIHPEDFFESWGITSALIISVGGLVGLVGVFVLAAFQWNGNRVLRPTYLALLLLIFVGSMLLFAAKTRAWGALGIAMAFGGWPGLSYSAAVTLPLPATFLLAWVSRLYVFAWFPRERKPRASG